MTQLKKWIAILCHAIICKVKLCWPKQVLWADSKPKYKDNPLSYVWFPSHVIIQKGQPLTCFGPMNSHITGRFKKHFHWRCGQDVLGRLLQEWLTPKGFFLLSLKIIKQLFDFLFNFFQNSRKPGTGLPMIWMWSPTKMWICLRRPYEC